MFTQTEIKKTLEKVRSRKIKVDDAFEHFKNLPYENLDFAKIDHHRSLRKGFPEAVYCPGKTLEQLRKIIKSIRKAKQNVILTRLDEPTFQDLREDFPTLKYSSDGRVAFFEKKKRAKKKTAPIAILTAGTTDIPVAEEAAAVLQVMNKDFIKIYDCGVAGLHRFLDQLPKLKKCKAVICIAGMEGALASVVAGAIDKPVIAVPTSVGYGASFEGLAALLTMMNSCAQGVAVVNIDNGFGAACFAASLS